MYRACASNKNKHVERLSIFNPTIISPLRAFRGQASSVGSYPKKYVNTKYFKLINSERSVFHFDIRRWIRTGWFHHFFTIADFYEASRFYGQTRAKQKRNAYCRAQKYRNPDTLVLTRSSSFFLEERSMNARAAKFPRNGTAVTPELPNGGRKILR